MINVVLFLSLYRTTKTTTITYHASLSPFLWELRKI